MWVCICQNGGTIVNETFKHFLTSWNATNQHPLFTSESLLHNISLVSQGLNVQNNTPIKMCCLMYGRSLAVLELNNVSVSPLKHISLCQINTLKLKNQ